MIKPAVKTAIIFALLWAGIKYLFYVFNILPDNITITGLINSLLLLLSIAVGVYLEKKKEGYGKGSAFTDLKKAITSGIIYTVLVSGFIYFYYERINPEFTQNRIETRMDQFYDQMQDEEYVASIKEKNEAFEVMTKEEIMRKVKSDTVKNLSPKSTFIFSLLGLMILSITYAIMVTLIYHKILFKDYYSNKEQ